MNTLRCLGLFVLALLPLATGLQASEREELAQITKERDLILTRLLAYVEASHTAGGMQIGEVEVAQLRLYTFRRDSAVSTADKIHNQELIITIVERQSALVRSQVEAGIATNAEVLEQRERLLAAKQKLLELKLAAP